MPDRRDIVDISFLPGEPDGANGRERATPARERKWLGVLFECCGAYARIYQTRDGKAYAGHCPRCNAALRVGIGEGGTSQRIFRAS